MSHTISARKADGFKVEVFAWDGTVAHAGWYQDRVEAQQAAEYHERLVTLGGGAVVPTLDDVFSDMDDDEYEVYCREPVMIVSDPLKW